MSDVDSPGARLFAEKSVEAFGTCGAEFTPAEGTESFEVGEDETIVVLGLVGGWRGAVAFRFDPRAVVVSAEAMAGEPVEEEDLRVEAILEAVNVVAGRGAAALAGEAGRAVWITPPLMAQGTGLSVRLMNLQGACYSFSLGGGSAGIMFSAAPMEGGHA